MTENYFEHKTIFAKFVTNVPVCFKKSFLGLFLYSTEEHMKEDSAIVLFLLIFHNHIKGTPSNADFSLPTLLFEKLKVPFTSPTYTTQTTADEQQKFTGENLKTTICASFFKCCFFF